MKVGLILTAAGKSLRFGGPTRKPFVSFKGKPLILSTLNCFVEMESLSQIVITVQAQDKLRMKELISTIDLPVETSIIEGGNTRKESVELGFNKLKNVDQVFIHDVARPSVSKALIDRLLLEADQNCAVIPGEPIVDTVKWVENGIVKETVPREMLQRIQTPQCIPYAILKKAYLKNDQVNATDESTLVEKLGIPVKVVQGDPQNQKVTFADDIKRLEHLD